MDDILVKVVGLKKYFRIKSGFFPRVMMWVKAVDGVDFSIRRGETFGVVGESGCGKTTLGRVIMGLDDPTEGHVFFEGNDIIKYSPQKLRALRKEIQIIFQDPYSSLDPRMTVGDIIGEALSIHRIGDKVDRKSRVLDLMNVVGLRPEHYTRYPHEFSGGQRQRVGIARALAVKPKMIVCDEAVSALDVSIQSQIINLLEDLQSQYNLTYIFIAHDLSVVEHISDRVAVMYLGKIVELSSKSNIYKNPLHPYTEALISAVPVPNPKVKKRRIVLKGDVPSPINPPPGCHFSTRCKYTTGQCKVEPAPPWEEFKENHWAQCWRIREIRSL